MCQLCCWKDFNFETLMSISSSLMGKGVNKSKQLMMSNLVQYEKATILYKIKSISVSPIFTFSFGET